MRWLRWLLGVLVVLAAVIVGGGFLLPDRVHVERSIRIDRPAPQIYDVIEGFARFNQWSPWFELDPDADYVYEGPTRGVGARLRWSGDPDTAGSGVQEIVAVQPNRSVTSTLDFGEQSAVATFTLIPDGASTQVVWGFDTNFDGDLVGRWVGLFMDRLIGPDYEKGLGNLKHLVESDPVQPTTVATPAM